MRLAVYALCVEGGCNKAIHNGKTFTASNIANQLWQKKIYGGSVTLVWTVLYMEVAFSRADVLLYCMPQTISLLFRYIDGKPTNQVGDCNDNPT